jgi:TolB-like protein
VLPVEDLSGGSRPDLFAEAVTEELIASLSKISALRVVSRSSVMPYRGTRKPVRQIGRELDVDAVVEGTIRRAGDRVRVTARLVTVPGERTLWTDAYERRSGDVLTLQSEVAQALAREIRIAVTPQERARLAEARPVDAEAFQLYLRGMYFFDKYSRDGTARAMEYFQQALGKDPTFAKAYAGLAGCYLHRPGIPLPIDQGLPKAREMAARALALDPNLAEAHAAMGYVLYTEWNFPGAEEEYRRAIALNANLASAHHNYSHLLLSMGRVEESLAESLKYLNLDPLSPAAVLHLGYHYLSAGQLDLAEQWNRKALDMDPNYYRGHILLGQTLEGERRYAEAADEYLKAFVVSGEQTEARIAELRRGFQNEGMKGFYRLWLDHARGKDPKGAKDPVRFAEFHARLGQPDEAFRYLELAFGMHADRLNNMKENPDLGSLRADPRFSDLLRRMKLPL